jgi:cytochrome o ubiquinol oxidase subunit III
MTAVDAIATGHDAHVLGLDAEHEGPAPKRIVTAYGFWIFLLSDMVMFSCFFAAYAVLLGETNGGP